MGGAHPEYRVRCGSSSVPTGGGGGALGGGV